MKKHQTKTNLILILILILSIIGIIAGCSDTNNNICSDTNNNICSDTNNNICSDTNNSSSDSTNSSSDATNNSSFDIGNMSAEEVRELYWSRYLDTIGYTVDKDILKEFFPDVTILEDGTIGELDLWWEEFYHPFILKDSKGYWLFYIDDWGYLRGVSSTGDIVSSTGHVALGEKSKVIEQNPDCWILLDGSELSIWRFGQKKDSVEIPEGGIFGGYNYYLSELYFRKGSTIYAIEWKFGKTSFSSQPEAIAEGVTMIVDASQVVDAECQRPVFLMNDGSLKYYSGDLHQLKYEGDYDGNHEFPIG